MRYEIVCFSTRDLRGNPLRKYETMRLPQTLPHSVKALGKHLADCQHGHEIKAIV